MFAAPLKHLISIECLKGEWFPKGSTKVKTDRKYYQAEVFVWAEYDYSVEGPFTKYRWLATLQGIALCAFKVLTLEHITLEIREHDARSAAFYRGCYREAKARKRERRRQWCHNR